MHISFVEFDTLNISVNYTFSVVRCAWKVEILWHFFECAHSELGADQNHFKLWPTPVSIPLSWTTVFFALLFMQLSICIDNKQYPNQPFRPITIKVPAWLEQILPFRFHRAQLRQKYPKLFKETSTPQRRSIWDVINSIRRNHICVVDISSQFSSLIPLTLYLLQQIIYVKH